MTSEGTPPPISNVLRVLGRWDTVTITTNTGITTEGWYWTHKPNLGHEPGYLVCIIPKRRPDKYQFTPTTNIATITRTAVHPRGVPPPLNW